MLAIFCGCYLSAKSVYANDETHKFKSIGNARFNFWFDIPDDWKATDKSANGDGYFIDTRNNEIDVRIYGSHVFPESDYYTELKLDPKYSSQRFVFHDGFVGTFLRKDKELIFIRSERDVHIIFFLEGKDEWMKKNEHLIKRIAGSIRFGKKE